MRGAFKLGDVVSHKMLKERGRIVRIADSAAIKERDAAYVVEIVPDAGWGMSAIEVLWRKKEIKKIAAG